MLGPSRFHLSPMTLENLKGSMPAHQPYHLHLTFGKRNMDSDASVRCGYVSMCRSPKLSALGCRAMKPRVEYAYEDTS